MGELLIFLIFILTLSILSIIGMYVPKNTLFKNICIATSIILIFAIGWLIFSAQPVNYIITKTLILIFEFVPPLILVGLFFAKKINLFILKISVAIILIISNICIYIIG